MRRRAASPLAAEMGTCFCFLVTYIPLPVMRDDASIVPYKLLATFVVTRKVSPRRGEGTPPYK